MCAEDLCSKVNHLLLQFPTHKDPKTVPFDNGLYFFYQDGEISKHGPEGRIVRIGNHPRSDDGLRRRLAHHYSGDKNASVFRKFIGGALLRKTDPHHPCLLPRPGEGHWEKQDLHPCEKCKVIESEISALLRHDFRFRCIEINNRTDRNMLEKKLVATISLCTVCKPSNDWLGLYTYSENVRKSGLWNSDYVFDRSLLLVNSELNELEVLIESAVKRTNR